MFTKKNALLLAALMLAGSTVSMLSCGGEASQPAETTTLKDNTAKETAALETEAVMEEDGTLRLQAIPDELPEMDLEGFNFRMYCIEEQDVKYAFSEEQNGSAINDAIFKKVYTVEERFNCDITLTDYKAPLATAVPDDNKRLLQKPIMAGDDVFDIAFGHDIALAELSLKGLFVNLYDIPYLNFDKPWWPSFTVDSLSVGKQMYLVSSYLTDTALLNTRAMFFNKDLMRNLDIEFPYQKVLDHTWTLDLMTQYVKSAYSDVNGNGKQDAEDVYGIQNWAYYCFLEGFGEECYIDDADGNLTYSFDLAQNQKIVDKLHDMLFSIGGNYIKDGYGPFRDSFMNGKSLFIYEFLEAAIASYSASSITYGILPMPLVDEAQESYFGGCTERPGVIPTTAEKHLEPIGLIVEALSAEGYKNVYPTVYEVALKSRYSDQEEDAVMLDLITEHQVLSFSYMYSDYKSPMKNMLQTLFLTNNGSTNVSSYAASVEKENQKRVEKLMDMFEKMR